MTVTSCPSTPTWLQQTLTILASVLTLALWSSPIRDVWTSSTSVLALKSTSSLNTGFPYVASCANCLLWILYATDNMNQLLVSAILNSVGLALNLGLSATYFYYARGHDRNLIGIQASIMLVFVLVGVGLMVAQGTESVGYMAAFVNVLMFAAPLAAASIVVRTRSTKGMPLLPLVFVLASSSAWFAFGLTICSIPIMIPNGLGVLLGAVQLILYRWAYLGETHVDAALRESIVRT